MKDRRQEGCTNKEKEAKTTGETNKLMIRQGRTGLRKKKRETRGEKTDPDIVKVSSTESFLLARTNPPMP